MHLEAEASRCRDQVAYTSAKKDAYVSKLPKHHFYQMCTYKVTRIILDSSMVEHSAVNRVVVGSSPTRGVFHRRNRKGSGCEKNRRRKRKTGEKIRLHGQAVKTSPFHGGNTGSIPVGVIMGY